MVYRIKKWENMIYDSETKEEIVKYLEMNQIWMR